MQSTDCPSSEEILRWAGGQYVQTLRHEEIEEHLSSCPSCGADLTIDVTLSEQLASVEPMPEDALPDPTPGLLERTLARQRAASKLIETHDPADWSARLLSHPQREDPVFLLAVAESSMGMVTTRPDAVLALAETLGGIAHDLPSQYRNNVFREEILSNTSLAAGVAQRIKGRHLAALAHLTDAERHVVDRPLSTEYARILLARGSSLRNLDRLAEARDALVRAGEVFARFDDVVGEAKVLWELAAVAYQQDRPDRSVALADRALLALDAEGEAEQSTSLRVARFGFLIGIPDAQGAEAAAIELQEMGSPALGPLDEARLKWLEGRLAFLNGDLAEAETRLEQAEQMFRELDSDWLQGCVLIDLAQLAGLRKMLPSQIERAQRAVTLLESVPAQTEDVARAVSALSEALRVGAELTELLVAVRRRLRVV